MNGNLLGGPPAVSGSRNISLIRPRRRPVRTITADNNTELAGSRLIEGRTRTLCYFATPYHAWERGTSENTNGADKRVSLQRAEQD